MSFDFGKLLVLGSRLYAADVNRFGRRFVGARQYDLDSTDCSGFF